MGNTDSIPFISQAKSLTQLAVGDVEGARRTQENFLKTTPIVSQVTSLVQALDGDTKAARETQNRFAKSLDQLSDGLPVVGHLKAAVYYAVGDDERGEQTIKSATGSAVSLASGAAGFVAGGPVGAAAGAALGSQIYDGFVTGLDTVIHGRPEYYGSFETYDKIHRGEASAGEIFDTIGVPVIDAATAALGVKLGKPKPKGIRCRRDVEYHLTSDEVEFATSDQALPESASEVLTANWQHLTVPQTVSNLVSLFIILRLILWNDKNGRNYSKELCTFTTDTDYLERCQNALLKTLKDMENHLASQKEDPTFVLNQDFDHLPGITNNSTIAMIRVTSTLYGMLESMGRGDKMGVKWLMALCLYEDISSYRICEDEVINKLRGLTYKAFYLGEARKQRVKRAGKRCGEASTSSGGSRKKTKTKTKTNTNTNTGNVYVIPKLNTNDFSSIKSIDTGTHRQVKNVNMGKGGRHESNHVPASSAYGKGVSINDLPAHSLPYDVHQFAMRKVGTSKSSRVAKTLRAYETDLINKGKMAEAIKLDLTASYGRANVLLDVNGNTKSFRPALVEYRKDMHAIINEHLKQNRISKSDASNLHKYVEDKVNYWGSEKPSWDEWFDHMEAEYKEIVDENGLTINVKDKVINVPTENRQYG